jgi:hypothetical protein
MVLCATSVLLPSALAAQPAPGDNRGYNNSYQFTTYNVDSNTDTTFLCCIGTTMVPVCRAARPVHHDGKDNYHSNHFF